MTWDEVATNDGQTIVTDEGQTTSSEQLREATSLMCPKNEDEAPLSPTASEMKLQRKAECSKDQYSEGSKYQDTEGSKQIPRF